MYHRKYKRAIRKLHIPLTKSKNLHQISKILFQKKRNCMKKLQLMQIIMQQATTQTAMTIRTYLEENCSKDSLKDKRKGREFFISQMGPKKHALTIMTNKL